MPNAEAAAQERRAKIRKITEAAAAKIRAEAKQKEEAAKAKQHALVQMAAMEYLRLEYGNKQKPAANALQETLGKACNCRKLQETLANGMRKPSCNLKSDNLPSMLRRNVEDRACSKHSSSPAPH